MCGAGVVCGASQSTTRQSVEVRQPQHSRHIRRAGRVESTVSNSVIARFSASLIWQMKTLQEVQTAIERHDHCFNPVVVLPITSFAIP